MVDLCTFKYLATALAVEPVVNIQMTIWRCPTVNSGRRPFWNNGFFLSGFYRCALFLMKLNKMQWLIAHVFVCAHAIHEFCFC